MFYDSRFKDFKGKLMERWLGPYLVEKFHENGSIQIKSIYEEWIPLIFDGHRLKLYKKPLSKEECISSFSREINVIGRIISLSPPKFYKKIQKKEK